MSDDRTEKPTPKRLKDARKKGQVARSRDLAQAASLLAAVLALGWMGGRMVDRLGGVLADSLRNVGPWATRPIGIPDVRALVLDHGMTIALLVGPLAVAGMIAAVAVQAAQGGLFLATEAVQMNWGRLNPANGFKRFGLSTGGVETLRMLMAVTMLSWMAYLALRTYADRAPSLVRLAPADGAAVMWDAVVALLKQAGLGMLVLGGADFLIQRQKLMKTLRMTRQEIKDELRHQDGDPHVKARIRAIQRAMVRKRMLSATRKATVVITNPTHYAVALEYRRSSMAAPRVVAKGQGPLAQRIKAIAREHGVPTVENVSLARALYAGAEVGDAIPAPLFEAVAEVLAYLIRLKQLVL